MPNFQPESEYQEELEQVVEQLFQKKIKEDAERRIDELFATVHKNLDDALYNLSATDIEDAFSEFLESSCFLDDSQQDQSGFKTSTRNDSLLVGMDWDGEAPSSIHMNTKADSAYCTGNVPSIVDKNSIVNPLAQVQVPSEPKDETTTPDQQHEFKVLATPRKAALKVKVNLTQTLQWGSEEHELSFEEPSEREATPRKVVVKPPKSPNETKPNRLYCFGSKMNENTPKSPTSPNPKSPNVKVMNPKSPRSPNPISSSFKPFGAVTE